MIWRFDTRYISNQNLICIFMRTHPTPTHAQSFYLDTNITDLFSLQCEQTFLYTFTMIKMPANHKDLPYTLHHLHDNLLLLSTCAEYADRIFKLKAPQEEDLCLGLHCSASIITSGSPCFTEFSAFGFCLSSFLVSANPHLFITSSANCVMLSQSTDSRGLPVPAQTSYLLVWTFTDWSHKTRLGYESAKKKGARGLPYLGYTCL